MTFSPPSGGHFLDTFSLRLQERSTLYHYHSQHVDALPNIISTHCPFKVALAALANMGKRDAILSPTHPAILGLPVAFPSLSSNRNACGGRLQCTVVISHYSRGTFHLHPFCHHTNGRLGFVVENVCVVPYGTKRACHVYYLWFGKAKLFDSFEPSCRAWDCSDGTI